MTDDGTYTLDELLAEGWRDAVEDPPNNDRLVQIAWDDGSSSPKTRGFYASVAMIPESMEKFWWNLSPLYKCQPGVVLAWREIKP